MTNPHSKPEESQAVEAITTPPEWRTRCDVRILTPHAKHEYFPLQNDLLRCLVEGSAVDFVIYFLVNSELYEYMRPADYSVELIKEMLEFHKKWPTQTRVLVLQKDYLRYQKLASAYRKKRFENTSGGASVPHMPVFMCYQELSDASQALIRGRLDDDAYARVSAASSFVVMHMQSTRSILRFLMSIVAKDALLYDHSAVTALVTTTIAWNVLELTKRASKLSGQAALMHDVERHCAHLFKPAQINKISATSIKDLTKIHEATGSGFHEIVVKTMGQHREKYSGGGYPGTCQGSYEQRGDSGIEQTTRIVSLACAFSEYLLKRQDKHSLSLEKILELIQQRTPSDFDPDIVRAFIAASTSDAIRKVGAKKNSSDEDSNDEYDND